MRSRTPNESGGRQPAVAGQTASATAMRGISACRFAFREHTTGGLRPPLLCCSANVCRLNNNFCDAQTQIRPRAAGVIPPWVWASLVQLFSFATAGLRQPLLAAPTNGAGNVPFRFADTSPTISSRRRPWRLGGCCVPSVCGYFCYNQLMPTAVAPNAKCQSALAPPIE
jgi:hypothetical protein